jgi:hypothetical protein
MAHNLGLARRIGGGNRQPDRRCSRGCCWIPGRVILPAAPAKTLVWRLSRHTAARGSASRGR